MDYKKVFNNFFQYSTEEFIPCCGCGERAVDIHHIDNKGAGGSKCKDFIENLAPVCRSCHDQCHDNKEFNAGIRIAHLNNVIKILIYERRSN